MKPETEIRNLKRELKRERNERWKWEGEAKRLSKELMSAESAMLDWMARFDLLLRREEPKP